MCLLIAKLSQSTWKPSLIEQSNAWESNPHGFGAAWITKGGELVYQKTLVKKQVAGIIKSIPKHSPCLLHWRFATHGVRTIDNCHPFPCFGGNWVGAHNGVLHQQQCIGTKTDSESFLATLEGSEPNTDDIEQQVDILGYGKLAFLSNEGEIRIANEDSGTWRIEREVWQSNSGLDSIPWYSMPVSQMRSGFGMRHKWNALLCDYCSNHAPLWDIDNEMVCDDCKEGAL
jgi:glutamine amidotransferase